MPGQKIFQLFFGRIEDTTVDFWNNLTFIMIKNYIFSQNPSLAISLLQEGHHVSQFSFSSREKVEEELWVFHSLECKKA